MKITYIILISIIFSISINLNGQSCSNQNFCDHDILGDEFDYRGQSTFGRLSPGDTSRVKVVLYSRNTVRILTCADENLGNVKFRILKTTREYNRSVERVDQKEIVQKIYKLKNGKKIPIKDQWGEISKSETGDTLFEIEKTIPTVINDTIWKTERNIREETIFDSSNNPNNLAYYEENIDKTKSVIIEVIVPPSTDEKMKYFEGCVAIMVGRSFKQK